MTIPHASTSAGGGLGISGRIAAMFQSARITPLLALVLLLLGLFAVVVTPREEEPQIDVTMADVVIGFPGAQVGEVEQMVAGPAEQVLSRMSGVEHVTSVSRPGVAVVTVQFKVGVARTQALVRLYDSLRSNSDWLPRNLGVSEPLVKPRGIDDVPIVTLTLFSRLPDAQAAQLEKIAHSMELELKRIPGTQDVRTIGGPGRAVLVELDPSRMAGSGVSVSDIRRALVSANSGALAGDLLAGNRATLLEAGPFLASADEVARLVVAARGPRAVHLADIAGVTDGAPPPASYVWHGTAGSAGAEFAAVTLAVTKKPGENAIDVADAVARRVESLRNTVIPPDVQIATTRNYGATANDKAVKLIEKLLFATACVVALVLVALGRREALIVGAAVMLTLMATLFASWVWGFTLNRVSLFALIFSIGILVDDAIVVVENIHRHQALHPERPLWQVIPVAVDEVGGPTILATLTVIAALLPMAFVTGLMGPYMSPIPINASLGMLLSLAIAFAITPWLARIWMPRHGAAAAGPARPEGRMAGVVRWLLRPLFDTGRGARNRRRLGVALLALVLLSALLPAARLVQLKMLPFDDKSELQIVVDMPAGTPLEQTAAVLRELGGYLRGMPEVANYQAYAGTSSPINFNGLVRQYYMRAGGEVGDLQVNLVPRAQRHEKSHAIATRWRQPLQAIGQRFGANVKVVEVPPGPPVLSPIVAEIYGPQAQGRRDAARQVREALGHVPGVVDVDDSAIADAPRKRLLVERGKAALSGVAQADVVATLATGLGGEDVTYLHDGSKYPVPVRLQLPAPRQGDLGALLQMPVPSASGRAVPVRELVTVSDALREQPVHHKDLLPVNYVTGDMAGTLDSPLYGMFGARDAVGRIEAADGGALAEYFVSAPGDAWRGYAVKWDGEWQITYETFRDMGMAYAVGLVLIYLLVVAQFGSYLTPLIIMAPIPLTVVGVMPGHALLGAQFTATSMIGMIALAGIIVRNSILLVDYVELRLREGAALRDAVVESAVTRAKPILLTALAAMAGAFFILDDPIFNGLAIALIFGVLVSTALTLVVIPALYYAAYRARFEAA